MDNLKFEETDYFLSNVPGVMVIDMDCIVIYVNDQCATFLGMDKKDIINRPVKEIFPPSKMPEGLKRDEAGVVFYSTHLGIGISAHIPLFRKGKKVGLLEYDLVQDTEELNIFRKSYTDFLDQELLTVENELIFFENAKYTISNIIGKSQAVIDMKQNIIAAAKSNSTVIISGETGTGKELVAHSIHNLSDRREHRMVKVNASAFPENLVESELFGYSEGAFTGASKKGKKGKFEQADGGTLFIDEINQMPLFVQPKLLRVLQEQEVDPIGADSSIKVNVRVMVSSNEPLAKLVEEKKFRKDLYYRLNVMEIEIPPLRKRKDDIEDLVSSKLTQLNRQMGKNINKVDDGVISLLKSYDWPGNIRELHNAIERAMNFAKGDTLTESHFSFLITEGDKMKKMNIEDVKREAERNFIIETLEQFDNNRSKTARYLNIDRSLLYQKMRRLGIK